MPRQKLYPAADVLQSLLQKSQSPLAQQFQRWRLWNDWAAVVGPSICRFSAPVSYHDGRLVIWVRDSAHLQEMHFFTRDIRERVNRHMGGSWVREIRYTLDPKGIPTGASDAGKDLKEDLNKLEGVHLTELSTAPLRSGKT